MATEKKTSITALITIAFIVFIFSLGIQQYAQVIKDSEHSNLEGDQKDYLDGVAGGQLNTENINASKYGEDETPQDPLVDATDNKNDFSLDFNFGKKSVNSIKRFVYISLNVPEFVLHDLFRLGENNFKWVVDLFDWFWRLMIIVSIIYFVRGINQG